MYKIMEKCEDKKTCKVTVRASELGGLISQCSVKL